MHLTRRHPATTLTYRLQRGGVVHVVVLQVGCGRISAFPVRAHGGTNTLRVRRTIKGRRLPDGTYRIRGRAHGRMVLRATLVIGKGGRAPCSLTAVTRDLASVFGPGSGGSASGSASATGAGAVSGSSGKLAAGNTAGARAGVRPHPASGVLGATVSKVLPGGTGTQLGLLIVLAGAILLLAVGALPRDVVPNAAAAAFLVRERVTIAAAGLSALAAVLIAYFIT